MKFRRRWATRPVKKLFYVVQLRSNNINISGRESEDQTMVAAAVGGKDRDSLLLSSVRTICFFLFYRGKKVVAGEFFFFVNM